MANPNPCPAARFKKGDARCWRKGRPKDFNAIRAMAQAIAHEELVTKEGNKMTIIAAVLRSWATSKEPTLQKAFIEYAFGKVPDHIEGKGFTAPIVILRHAHQQPQREAGGRQKYGP